MSVTGIRVNTTSGQEVVLVLSSITHIEKTSSGSYNVYLIGSPEPKDSVTIDYQSAAKLFINMGVK